MKRIFGALLGTAICLVATPALARSDTRGDQGRRTSLDFLDLTESRAPRVVRGFTPLLPDTLPNAGAATPEAAVFDVPAQPSLAPRPVLQCVPYARKVSGIQIYGDALNWWDQAEGRYDRGVRPRVGAVLALQGSDAMPGGHVAAVSRILSSREILIDHANWSGPGLIERGVLAVDVSPENDWSQVRIWYGPSARLGTRINPAFGFIYPARPALGRPVRLAAVETRAPRRAAPVREEARSDYDPFVVEYVESVESSRTEGLARR